LNTRACWRMPGGAGDPQAASQESGLGGARSGARLGRAARSGPPGGPAAGGRQGGRAFAALKSGGAGRRSQFELRRRECCPAASRIVRLAAFRNLRDEFRFHVAHSAANLLDLFLQLRVRNEPADLRERRLQPSEGGPVDHAVGFLYVGRTEPHHEMIDHENA